MHRISVALAVLVALFVLSGCGGGSDSEALGPTLGKLRQELSAWTGDTERLTDEVDAGRVSALDFHPAAVPLNGGELDRVSSDGEVITADAFFSEKDMEEASNLTQQEIKNMYCYLFSWYQKEGSLPQPDQLERFFYEDLKGRLIPSAPPEKFQSAAKLLSESITNAHSSGEAGANVAIAAMCSVPKRE